MQSKLILYLLILLPFPGRAQLLEAESVPRSFDIDHSTEIHGTSPASGFDILPYRVRIRNEMERRARKWFDESGKKSAGAEDFEQRFIHALEEIQPDVIQDIGASELKKGKPYCFLKINGLQFEVFFPGFKPVYFDMPLKDIESFQANVQRLVFSEPKVAFDNEDHFVITYLRAYNPSNQQEYTFECNLPADFKNPSFNISMPNIKEE